MRYKSFKIINYRAIKKELVVNLDKRIIPLVGLNECGKTTILQAIFCFDSSNDKEYNGKHLENTGNLYETDNSKPAIITASIESTASELEEILHETIEQYKGTIVSENADELNIYYNLLSNQSPKHKFTFEMSRNLSTKKYFFISVFNGLPESEQHKIGVAILNHLPFILYNDDFNDRPPDSIPITKDKSIDKSGWEAIFDRVFASTNSHYSLNACADQGDIKKRLSILSDVRNYLNKALTHEWRRFSPNKDKISILLDMDENASSLKVLIEDSLNGNSRFFSISDRSKGFIWYYNFIMKVRFNPRYTDNIQDTVFLLDEPGSYLHENAQESLCRKLVDISHNEGVVVYCTHSPKLLIPSVIPICNITIVDKSSKGYITAKNINDYKTSSKRTSAMQPVFESLMIPEYKTIHSTDNVLCVEGIYDKYAIELFADLPQNCIVFPSVNADSIINNIQYYIAYKLNYIALWDNDEEGKRCFGKAKKIYGPLEEKNMILLPSKDAGKRRMEEMFENDDLTILCQKMNLPRSSTYETIISSLYFLDKRTRSEIVQCVSQETKNNFSTLSKMIKLEENE